MIGVKDVQTLTLAELEIVSPNTVANTCGPGFGNVGGISLGGNCVIVIDTTMFTKTALDFRRNLEKHFDLPLKYLVYTHYHGDHVFGGKAFKDLIKIGSSITADNLNQGWHVEWKEGLEKEDPLAEGGLEILPPEIVFNKKLTIRENDQMIDIVHSDGHTSGSSYILFPSEKVLFAGDLIFEDSFPYACDYVCNPDKWIDALESFKTMNIDKIVPGHGPVLNKKSDIDKHLKFFKELRKVTLDAVEGRKGEESIVVPSFIEEKSATRIPLTVERWYTFYKIKLGLNDGLS